MGLVTLFVMMKEGTIFMVAREKDAAGVVSGVRSAIAVTGALP